MTGGGSGGHITPLLAVAHEIKKADPKTVVAYIGQRGDSLGDIPAQHASIDQAYVVRAGKLRRYHGEGWVQVLDIPTTLKNIRDVWWVFVGFWQSLALLRRLKPDVLFVKGGFVGVPVGLAAAVLRIPYITHDSDALPGLANRIIARWARLHTVALPKEVYSYPHDKTEVVGVPIAHQYHVLTPKEIAETRSRLGLPVKGKVLLVTGGGLGAQRLNNAVVDCVPGLLEHYPDLTIVHMAGRALEAEVRQQYKRSLTASQQERVHIKGFVTNLHDYSGVSDVVITRAGGTSMAEFAAQAKACLVVPNPLLTGGHQIKNSRVLASRRAAVLLPEDKLMADHGALMPALVDLLDHPAKVRDLGQALHKLSQANAAERLAVILLDVGAKTRPH